MFERVEVSLETAQEVFQHNAFKLHYLSRLPVGAAITLYRLADFVDLCLGPHLPNSGGVSLSSWVCALSRVNVCISCKQTIHSHDSVVLVLGHNVLYRLQCQSWCPSLPCVVLVLEILS